MPKRLSKTYHLFCNSDRNDIYKTVLRSYPTRRPTFPFQNVVRATFQSIEPLISPYRVTPCKRIDLDKSCVHRPMNRDSYRYHQLRFSWEKRKDREKKTIHMFTLFDAFECIMLQNSRGPTKNHNK